MLIPAVYFATCIIVDSTKIYPNLTVNEEDDDNDKETEVDAEYESFDRSLEFSKTEMYDVDAWRKVVVVPIDLACRSFIRFPDDIMALRTYNIRYIVFHY